MSRARARRTSGARGVGTPQPPTLPREGVPWGPAPAFLVPETLSHLRG